MATAKLGSYQVYFYNSEEYHRLKQEIFTQDNYYFETHTPHPVIIDAGAHIGLATLYFKRIYPGSSIIAIEPHPDTFQYLEQNIFANQLENVTLVQAALSTNHGTADFYADTSAHKWFSTASFIPKAWNHQQNTYALTVPTVPLADYLDQPIDFLKMDIEGAEQAVLTAARDKLRQVKQMMIEFHPGEHQSLTTILEMLNGLGFAVKTWKDGKEVFGRKATGLVLLDAVQSR